MPMRLGIRQKLVALGLLIVVVVSSGFTLVQLRLSHSWVEEDLRARAVVFAREISATIGDRREFESGPLLQRQITQIMGVRQSVLQLDILAFAPEGTTVIASSHPARRLPFTAPQAQRVRQGQVVSQLAIEEGRRRSEVMAPVTLEGAVVGAVAVKFSLARADAFAARARVWAFTLTAASALVMGLLMWLAAEVVVNRPIRRFRTAIARVQRGDTTATVEVVADDELGLLARHFNEMLGRIRTFSEELNARIKEATRELENRYQEVERLNELLFTMQRSLSHAERLALSGRIMAEVAHEVGTPLHSVAGHLELLRQDLPPELLTDAIRRRLAVIQEQLARVTEIIAQLLDLTRRSPGEPRPLDLNRLARDTAELVRPGVAKAGITLHVETAPSPLPVVGHSSQLQQVVLNLLTNAVDATLPGGRVRLVTRPAPGDQVALEVADTGRGIPQAALKQIFEPFFSTKETGRGTGLGLFISAQIAREHRGRIDVESEEGRGSTFRLLLPAGAAAA